MTRHSIDKPIYMGKFGHGQKTRTTYKLHNRPYRALYIYPVVAINRDQARRATESRELNKSCVVAHNGFEVISSVSNHPI